MKPTVPPGETLCSPQGNTSFHPLKQNLYRRLLSFDYPFNVIQLIQRFERCQVVDIEIQYFVAYLA